MSLTASKLRQNVYQLLDQVIETGEPLTIERKGQILAITRMTEAGGKLAQLTPHPCIQGDPESLVYGQWEDAWNPGDL